MDIIFFAALTLFIFFKVKNQLGKVDEDQKREAIKKFLKQQANVVDSPGKINSKNRRAGQPNLVIVNPDAENAENLDNIQIINKTAPAERANLIKVLDKSKVTATEFIDGAEKAFEMIIKSFCEHDKKTLEFLLTKSLYNKFVKVINNREKSQQKLVTNIVALDDIIINNAKLEKNMAVIKVNFKSKQINYTIDKDKKIIEGSDNIIENDDIWTFERDIKSQNPNWTIISTKS